jgi:hypothetical protein
MIVRFTRLSPTHHRFEAVRDDGAIESRELETRSFLLHDLVHFALESEGKLNQGFYGAIAHGGAYETEAAAAVESVVGPLQGALKGEIDPSDFVARFRATQESIGADPPDWLSEDLIARTLERLRQLQGQWRATPFGGTMELRFDVYPPAHKPAVTASGGRVSAYFFSTIRYVIASSPMFRAS